MSAGLHHVQHRIQQFPAEGCDELICLAPPYFSGGAAAGDYDGDGRPDLFFTRLDDTDLLYRNNGDGTFSDVTAAAGLGGGIGNNAAAWADFDNDGDLDLYVTTTYGYRHFMYINDGQGRFSEEAVARGTALDLDVFHIQYSIAAGDYDNDGWIDIHTSEQNSIFGVSHSRLFHNRGAAAPGYFTDETDAAGLSLINYPGLPMQDIVRAFTSRFVDLDNDRWPDLAVAADHGTSRLFWNDGDGTFSDGTVAAAVGTDRSGMGSAIGDYDGDGWLDWFVTAIWAPEGQLIAVYPDVGSSVAVITDGNRMYHNRGDRTFSDATDDLGVREGGFGWGTAFLDFDNDGDLDLVMTNGQFLPDTDVNPFVGESGELWRNDGAGVWTEISADTGFTKPGEGKGLVELDYDGDGDLDVLVVMNGAAPVLYRNDSGNENDWLRVRVVGTVSNRDGIGARVIVTPRAGGPSQMREISGGSNFLGQGERTAHFGLGPSALPVSRVQVYWPASGETQERNDVSPGQTLVFVETAPALCLRSGTCAPCDDHNPCTEDLWSDANGCSHLPAEAECDDDVFCNGPDACRDGACSVHAGDPCTSLGVCRVVCDETADACQDPAGTMCDADENVCTLDQCDGLGDCSLVGADVENPACTFCAADCNGDGSVTASDLRTGIAVALDRVPMLSCRPADRNRDQRLTIDELVAAVRVVVEDDCPG